MKNKFKRLISIGLALAFNVSSLPINRMIVFDTSVITNAETSNSVEEENDIYIDTLNVGDRIEYDTILKFVQSNETHYCSVWVDNVFVCEGSSEQYSDIILNLDADCYYTIDSIQGQYYKTIYLTSHKEKWHIGDTFKLPMYSGVKLKAPSFDYQNQKWIFNLGDDICRLDGYEDVVPTGIKIKSESSNGLWPYEFELIYDDCKNSISNSDTMMYIDELVFSGNETYLPQDLVPCTRKEAIDTVKSYMSWFKAKGYNKSRLYYSDAGEYIEVSFKNGSNNTESIICTGSGFENDDNVIGLHCWYTKGKVATPNIGVATEDDYVAFSQYDESYPYDLDSYVCTKEQAIAYLVTHYDELINTYPDATYFILRSVSNNNNGFEYMVLCEDGSFSIYDNKPDYYNEAVLLYCKQEPCKISINNYNISGNSTLPEDFKPCNSDEIIDYINKNRYDLSRNSGSTWILYNYFWGRYEYALILGESTSIRLYSSTKLFDSSELPFSYSSYSSNYCYTKRASADADTVSSIKVLDNEQINELNQQRVLPSDFCKCTPSAAKEYLANNLSALKQYFPDIEIFTLFYRFDDNLYHTITSDRAGNITQSAQSLYPNDSNICFYTSMTHELLDVSELDSNSFSGIPDDFINLNRAEAYQFIKSNYNKILNGSYRIWVIYAVDSDKYYYYTVTNREYGSGVELTSGDEFLYSDDIELMLNYNVHFKYIKKADPVEYVKTEASNTSCTESGSIEYYTDPEGRLYYGANGILLNDRNHDGEINEDDTITESGSHDWNEPTYVWADDNNSVTASRICKNDPTHIETETVDTVYRITKEPTYSKEGEAEYIASFTNAAFNAQTKVVSVEMLAPEYGEPTYQWSDDNTSVTAIRKCVKGDAPDITETADTSYEVTKAAACEETGIGLYTASFNDPLFEIQTKEVTIPATGHDWNEPSYVWADDNTKITASRICKNDASHIETEERAVTSQITKAATVSEKGEIVYTSELFENPAFSVQSKTEEIAQLMPEYSESTYTWSADNSSVTAERVCLNDPAATISESVDTTSEITKQPTCYAKGETTYYAEFENPAFTKQEKTVDDIKMTEHTPADAVIENNIAPTYDTEGAYDEVVYCSVCHEELSRNHVEQPCLERVDITSARLIANPIAFAYDGEEHSVSAKVRLGDTLLVEGVDYTLTENTATNAGTYMLVAEGIGRFTGKLYAEWKISDICELTATINNQTTKTFYERGSTVIYTSTGKGAWFVNNEMRSIRNRLAFTILEDSIVEWREGDYGNEAVVNCNLSDRKLVEKGTLVSIVGTWSIPDGAVVQEAGIAIYFTDTESDPADKQTVYESNILNNSISILKTPNGTYTYDLTMGPISSNQKLCSVCYIIYLIENQQYIQISDVKTSQTE